MKFTDEDGIISAAEAADRSDNGTEDSMVREELREIMARIRHNSGYRLRGADFVGNIRPMNKEVVKILKNLGYQVCCHQQGQQIPHVRFDWRVSW